MSSNRLVSVAMCTYNGELYLDEQIQSILNQDYPEIELLISDDNSTDNTWEVLKNYQTAQPERIRIYRNEQNLGYNKNFEKVISYCQGAYIAIADQDDIWLPDKISSLQRLLLAENAILAHCASANFSTNPLHLHSDNRSWSTMFSGNDVRELVFKNQISGHNMLFKSELKDKLLPIPENVYYDWWIAAIAACHGTIAPLPEIKVKRRLHGSNAFRSIKFKKAGKLQQLVSFLRNISLQGKLSSEAADFISQAKSLVLKKEIKNPGKFDRDLFRFIIKNRYLIFKYKKRSSKLSKEWSMMKAALTISSY